MAEIRLVITDFDGTLVDTFEANLKAYQKAFAEKGLELSEEKYRECFGFRFDDFMNAVGISDEKVKNDIRTLKGNYYPEFFSFLKPNNNLINFIKAYKAQGSKTAIASTARGKNLYNVLSYLKIENIFDYILSGEDVKCGKPNPEIYQKVMTHFGVLPENTLVFEDSQIGIEASVAAGANYIQIKNEFINN